MLTLIFTILMFVVFGKMLGLSIRAAWGITKIIFNLIILPFLLIALVVWGLVNIAVPALVVIGVVTLVKAART